jgi:DNA invertase Pin-like site-specific DNA recombinase
MKTFSFQQWKGSVCVMFQNGACYIRVSTDEQTEFSPDAQLRVLKEYARKNSIILSKQYIYIDEGISGKRADKRPEFMKMIATAKSKPTPFDVILVHKFDRFARSREDSVVYKSLLKKEANIKVVSITETIEDDKFSVILEAMLEAMAEYYSLNLADEVKKGMTEKALRGEYQTTPPLGYTMANKKLVVVPEQAEFIKTIFNKFASKQMGLRAIAGYANELGLRTKRGNLFENRTIEYILNNPVYIGKTRWTPTGRTRRNYHNPDSIITDGAHESIISMELWDKVQDAMATQKELYGKWQKPNAQLKTWLKGLIRCGNCGATLVRSSNSYLLCNAYAKGACKFTNSITIDVMERLVLEQLKKTFRNELEITIVPKVRDVVATSEFDMLNERLNKLALKEQRIKEAYKDGIDTLDEYKENKCHLKEERQNLEQQLIAIKTDLLGENEQGETVTKRIKNVYSLLTDKTIDMQVKYDTAHFLISKIIYKKQDKSITIEYK